MTLIEMVRDYQTLLERKDSLSEETKANNAAIEAAKERISQQMVDDDCPSISTGGYKFTLQAKTIYSKKSEADIARTGTTLFEVLRDEGLGDIIQEQVNTRTLQSTMKDYVEEYGDLSDDLKKVIRSYDTYDIARRKDTNKAAKGGRPK